MSESTPMAPPAARAPRYVLLGTLAEVVAAGLFVLAAAALRTDAARAVLQLLFPFTALLVLLAKTTIVASFVGIAVGLVQFPVYGWLLRRAHAAGRVPRTGTLLLLLHIAAIAATLVLDGAAGK